MGDWHSGFGWGHGLIGVLFWVLVIVLIAALFRLVVPSSRSEDRALELLRERYARGELSREEYDDKRRELER